jgi:hypothetical protein
LYAGNRGAYARVFGNITGVVLGNVEVSADKNTFTSQLASRAQIRKANEFHGTSSWGQGQQRLPTPTIVNTSASYQPSPKCSGKYTAMPATIVPSKLLRQ